MPGAWDPFELSVRAIVGQQVSIAATTTVFNRIVAAYGEPFDLTDAPPVLSRLFPPPSVLATADLTSLGIVKARAHAINHLASVVAQNLDFFDEMLTLEDTVQKLSALPGIGPWTAHYIAMRALSKPDAFPPGDIALIRAVEQLGYTVDKAKLMKMSEEWRPWRAYAAMCL